MMKANFLSAFDSYIFEVVKLHRRIGNFSK